MKSKLTDLNARFIGHGGPGVLDAAGNTPPRQEGVGVILDCPCGCDQRLFVPFENPIEGPPILGYAKHGWKRTGDTIEELTLQPSIQRMDPKGCKWHGFITKGEAMS